MGVTPSYQILLARIREMGSFSIGLDELPVPLAEFRRDMRRVARADGLRVLSLVNLEHLTFYDPEYRIAPERLREVMEAAGLDIPTVPR